MKEKFDIDLMVLSQHTTWFSASPQQVPLPPHNEELKTINQYPNNDSFKLASNKHSSSRQDNMVQAKSSLFGELSGHYRTRMEECKSLLSNKTVKTVPFLREDLETLLNLSELALTILKEDIELAADDEYSQSIVDKWHKSRFSPAALTHHFSIIKENVKKVEGYIDHANAEGIDIKLGDSIQSCVKSADDIVFSFTFNIKAFKSEDLQHAYRCLGDDDFVSKSPYLPKAEDPMQKANERGSDTDGLNLLVLYSKENGKESNKKFVVSNGSKCPDESIAYTSIFTNEGEELFELPGKPSKPVYVKDSKTANSVKIEITPSDIGQQSVTGYKVTVFELGIQIRSIDVPKIDAGPTEFRVEDLRQGMEYSFKVQSVSRAGSSPKSAMSDKVVIDSGVTYKASRGIRLSSGSHA